MAPINRPVQRKVDEMQPFQNGSQAAQKTSQPVSITPAIGFQERSYGPIRAGAAGPVYVNKTHPTDFPWKIEWNAETCIRCGSCVAACTFGAIEPHLMRQGQTVSVGNFPTPVTDTHVVMAIRQVPDCHGSGPSHRYTVGRSVPRRGRSRRPGRSERCREGTDR